MELTNLALAYQVHYLNKELINGFVNKVQRLENGYTRIKIHTKNGSKDLIIAEKAVFITSYGYSAKKNFNGFEALLKKILYNKRIKQIIQPEYERTIRIEFEEHSLICDFYPESNIVLVDSKNKVEAFKHQFKSMKRKLKKGQEYPEKELIKLNPLKIKQLNETSEKQLIEKINIDPLIVKEILATTKEKIIKKIIEFHTVNEKKLKPVIIGSKIYPFPLKNVKKPQKQVKTINEELDEFYKKEISEDKKIIKEKKTREKELNKIETSIKQQLKSKQKFEKQIIENKQKAELIYQNYQEIEEIIKAVKTAVKKGLREKEIMQKFKQASEQGNKTAKKIKKINLKTKEIEIEI